MAPAFFIDHFNIYVGANYALWTKGKRHIFFSFVGMLLRLSIVILTTLLPIMMNGQQIELNLFTPSEYNDGSHTLNNEAIVNLNEDFVESFVSLVPKPRIQSSSKPHLDNDLIPFKRLSFLSPSFRDRYEQSFGSRPPYLFSHVEQGSNLINILTYTEPIINYHSSEGNYNLVRNKTTGRIWSRQLSSRSIETFVPLKITP